MDNIYYGPTINENYYFREWQKIFTEKEDSVSLLYSIVELDSENTEDLSIGAQAIACYIKQNKLWVSEEIVAGLVANISLNFEYIESWFSSSINKDIYGYNESWINKRRSALLKCITELSTWHKIVRNNYNISIELYNIIEKQKAFDGSDIGSILNNTFSKLKDIAKSNYGILPNIEIPKDISEILKDIKTHLNIICTNDSTIMDSIKKIDNILSKKKWLI